MCSLGKKKKKEREFLIIKSSDIKIKEECLSYIKKEKIELKVKDWNKILFLKELFIK